MNYKWKLAFSILFLGISACSMPQPPDKSIVQRTDTLSEDALLHTMNPWMSIQDSRGHPLGRRPRNAPRNAIFIAVEDYVQNHFRNQIHEIYPHEKPIPRVEEIGWWMLAPDFPNIYSRVLRIKFDRFRKDSFEWALEYAEKLGKPFDLYLLTHGKPNRITTSSGEHAYTFASLAKLAGKLPHLTVVYMQQCYGSSLAEDWHKAGAKVVMSQKDEQENYLFVDLFTRFLSRYPNEPRRAYVEAAKAMKWEYHTNYFYHEILSRLHQAFKYLAPSSPEAGMTLDEFIDSLPAPEYRAWK